MEVTVIKIKPDLSTEEYFNKIRPYLKNIMISKKSDTWKIQLLIAINSMSSKDKDEEHVMHSKSDNIEIRSIKSLLSRYQIWWEIIVKVSVFIFDCINAFWV